MRPMMRYGWFFLAAVGGHAGSAGSLSGQARPNVVVIVVDDLRWDEFGAAGHPYLKTPNIDRLAREGATFLNMYNVTPLCSPNRASILTGQYVSRHGILDNVDRSRSSHRLQTFTLELKRLGYETAHIGKWHMGNDPTPRPGYDYWVSFPGQGRTINPEIYEGGRLHVVEGHVTDVLNDRALAFLERQRTAPFLLYVGHKAVHPEARQLADGSTDPSVPMEYIPADRHRGMYADAVFPRRPNVVAPTEGRRDKPVIRQALEWKNTPEMDREFGGRLDHGTSERNIRGRAEMLMAVDEGVGQIFAALERLGQLDNTLIVFTSDNGYFFGEHGLSIERRLPYEESARAPLLIRYPGLARAGSTVQNFALSIDIAPTVLEVARGTIGSHVQGRSLVPLLRGETAGWRRSFLIEYVSHENPMPWLIDMGYRAVRSGRYKLVHWLHFEGGDELYDLETDPYEMTNVIGRADLAPVVSELRADLSRLVVEAMGLTPR